MQSGDGLGKLELRLRVEVESAESSAWLEFHAALILPNHLSSYFRRIDLDLRCQLKPLLHKS